MGKKGSFQFDDDDDLDFGDEMFPMDDDAFGDFDSFGGSEEGGKKGFFKNVAKSIKGLGVDIIGEFLPEAVSLKDELSMSISDASGKLTELKEAMADKKIKSSSNKGAFKKDIADMGKNMANDLKKGKLYKSEADAPLNMDFGDDDYGDDDDDGPSEPEDTSGKLTTKMSSSKKYKPNKLIVETSNANEIKAMEKIQQNAVITNAKIQSRMNTKNMMMTEHNFNAQISVLKNIASNIYNISNFISKEGVTSVKANLEYGAKSLAFMADQNALLKDLITTSKKQIGEYKDENDSVEPAGSKDPFFMGSFSLGNYLSKIGENAKDMFGNSMAGQAYGAYQMQDEMMKGMGMKKQTPAQMVAGMLKQSIPGLLLSGNTKNKLENANTLIGGLGGSFVSRMNRLAENSDNPLLTGLGQLLGIDTYNDKSVAMGIANPKGAVPFDQQSHKTLNTVIPGYLGKITALLGGGEETYFDYKSNTFKTVSSKKKQYELVKSEAMNSNMHFSQGMDSIYKNALTKNDTTDAGVDPETLKNAFNKFKENVVDSKMELNRNDLMNKNKKDYQEKIFAGIRGRDEKETRAIRSILTASVDQLANSGVGLQMLNSGIHTTASNVSAATKQFKEDSLMYGGDLAMAETNINEKYDASDFNLKYSKAYNVDKHKIGTKGYLNALQNAAMVRQSEFMERGGLVGSINPDSDIAPGMGGSVNASASQTLTNIYDLLLGGIIVFPAKMTNADNKRLTSLQDNRSDLLSASKKRKEEEKLLEESRSKDIVNEMLSVKRQSTATNLASFADDSIAGKIRNALGVDKLMSGLSDGIGTVFGKITGQGATGDLNSYSLADNSEVKEILEAREAKNNALANGIKGFGADLYSKAKVKSGGKGLVAGVSRLFTNSVEKSKNFYDDHKDDVSSYLSNAQKSLNEKKLKAKDFAGAQFGKLKAAKDNLVGKMPKGFVEGVSNYTTDLKRNYYGTKGYVAVVGKFSKKRLNELFEIIKANGFEPTNSINSEVAAYIGSPSSEEKDTIKENNIYKIGGTNISDSAIIKFLSEDYYNIYQNQMYDDEDVEEDTQTTSRASKRKIKQADMYGSNALVRSRTESSDKVSKPLISISTVKNDNSVRRGAIRKTGGVSIDKGSIASIGKLSSGVNTTNKILSRIEVSIKGLKRGGKERVKRVREKRKKGLLSRAFGLVPKAFGAAGKLAKGAFGLVPKAFGVAGKVATGAFGLGKKALGFGAKVVRGGLSLPGHLLKGIRDRKREDKQMVKKLKEIKAKIESGEELTEEEKTYWDLNSERLDKPSKTDLIKKGFGFLLTNTKKVFSFVATKGLSLGKNLMTNGRTYLTRSIGAVMTLIKGKSVDDLSDEEVIAYAAKLTGKPIDELKTMPIENLRSIVGEDLKRKTPLNKLKGILSFARSKITGISQASREKLSQLKKEVKIRGEEFYNSLTRDEAIARLSELLNVPKETLQSMTLDEAKARLREIISGKMKLTGARNLFGKIGSAFKSMGGGFGGISFGSTKIGFGEQLLGETRAIRIMLEKQYGPVNMGAIMNDIKASSAKIQGGFGDKLKGAFSNGKEFLGDKFGKLKDKFTSGKLKSGFGKLKDKFTNGKEFLGDKFGKLKDKFTSGKLKSGFGKLKDKFTNGKEFLGDKFTNGKEFLGDKYGNAKEFLGNKYGNAKEFLGNKHGKLKDKFSNAKEFLGDKYGNAKSFFKSKFDGTTEGTYHDKKNDKLRDDKVKDKVKSIHEENLKQSTLLAKMVSIFSSGKLDSGVDKLKDKVKFGGSFFKSKFDGIARNEDGTIEGTYHDKKNDKLRDDKLKRESTIHEETLKQSALLATIASILASGMPAGAQKKIAESNKSILKGGVGKLAKFLGGATIGLAAAGVATAGAAVVALGKKTFDKIKLSKTELKNTTFGEKVNFVMGGSSGANYDSHGNEVAERDRSTRGFGLSKLRLGTVVGIGGINKAAGGFIKLITKILNNPKIAGKLGKKGVSSIVKYLTGKISKNFLVKAAGKIGSLLTKASNPVGWAIIAAQTAADFISGMNKTSRYFKLGKGIKPTLAMRLTSGVVNVLSGLLFGLIPTETLVNKIYEITAKDSVKDAINKGKDFVDKRAKVLGVDGKRLAEYETMTWNERLFGGTTKAATILGFATGKDDTEGIAKYKEWRDSKYKPLMEIYENMKDEYGKKVESVSEDESDILNQNKFRESYLKASSSYVTQNNLGDIGVFASKSFGEEESIEGGGDSSGSASISSGGSPSMSSDSDTGSAAAASAAASTAVTGVSAISPSGSESNTTSGSVSSSGGSSLAGGNLSAPEQTQPVDKKPGFFSRLFKGTLTGAMMLPGIKGAMAAITAFKNKRKESEAELDNLFNQNDTKAIAKIADNIHDKRIAGQVSSLSSLNPEFAKRMESFLKDPRIAGRGVKLRETVRSPLTQLAYYSKGRAAPSITDMLMKKAGFKQGINFWPKSFQGPGQYTTWTLGSNHFDGTAVDLEPGDIGYDALGSIASEYGINWGGSWKNSDPPHFELDPNWKEGSETENTSSGVASNKTSTSKLSDSYQADATNYSKGRVSRYKHKSVFHKQQPIGIIPSLSRSIISSSSKSNHTSGTLGMTILESKLDQIYNIAFEGNQLLGELLNEQKRHNKVAEESFGNIIKGIMMLGKIASSSGSGGFSSNSITNNLFDALARGV